MKRLIAALALMLMLPAALPAAAAPYVLAPGQTCDGWPRLPIEMAPGLCAGLVVAPPPGTSGLSKRSLRMPRTLVQLPGGDWIVPDLGGWDPGKGSVWPLRASAGRAARLAPPPKGPAQAHLHRRPGGRNDSLFDRLRHVRQQKPHRRLPHQGRPVTAGDRDQRNGKALGMGQHVGQFRRLARVRQDQQHIPLSHHAQIAMARLGRVDEMRGRAGRGKGRRDLAADMA